MTPAPPASSGPKPSRIAWFDTRGLSPTWELVDPHFLSTYPDSYDKQYVEVEEVVYLRLKEGSAYRRSAFHVQRRNLGEVDEQMEAFLYQNFLGLVPGVRGNPLKIPGVIREDASLFEETCLYPKPGCHGHNTSTQSRR